MDDTWNRFFRQFQRDAKLWLLFVVLLGVFRAAFLITFRKEIGAEATRWDIAAVLLQGLRFDAMAATYWMIPSLVCTVWCGLGGPERAADRVRQLCGTAYVVVTIPLCCVAIEYFREFDDVFNHFLFKFCEDSPKAIVGAAYSDYHLGSYLLLSALLIAAVLLMEYRWFLREFATEEVFGRHTTSPRRRLAINILLGGLFVAAVRGSIGSRPAQLKDTAVTTDRFLNKAVLNPHMALYYATKAQLKLLGEADLKRFLPDEDIAAALSDAFPAAPSLANIDRAIERTSSGVYYRAPRHVFLVFAESCDAWPLLDKYRSLGVAEHVRRLGREGLHVQAFVPASDGSLPAYVAMVDGLPHVSNDLRFERAPGETSTESLPAIFRRLGYRTRFFFGGRLTWCNIGDVARRQGFEEIYGGAHIVPWYRIREWGVQDELLFDFIRATVVDDVPSFNFVMTASYHPPYDLDLAAEGCPLTRVPDELKSEFQANPASLLKILGHRWYADRALGRFVGAMEPQLARPLFVITGDHYSRHFINRTPTAFERWAVPLVLYGKDVLRGVRLPDNVAGSHIDILPTLVELAAPKGFSYRAFGQNLLEPRREFLGFGRKTIIGPDFLVELGDSPEFHPLPHRPFPQQLPALGRLTRLHGALFGVAWWRLKRGPELPGARPEILLAEPARGTRR